MARSDRHEKLIKILEATAAASVSDLSNKLNVSTMTIRRDLDKLNEQGVLKKIHGGAVFLKNDTDESDVLQPSFQKRIDEFGYYKNMIGREAIKYINNGDVVFFDAGTTTLAMIPHIPPDIEFTAITPAMITAVSLCNNKNVNVITVGGNIHHSSYSSVNYMAIEMINKFNADTAFISTKAFISPIGTFEAALPLLEVKRAIVQNSTKTILLADHSKFGEKSLCEAISISDIDMIITDNMVSSEILSELREYTNVVIAK